MIITPDINTALICVSGVILALAALVTITIFFLERERRTDNRKRNTRKK